MNQVPIPVSREEDLGIAPFETPVSVPAGGLLQDILVAPTRPWRWLAGAGLLSLMSLLLYFSVQTPSVGDLLTPPWDKVVHFSMFVVVGTLAWVASGGRSPWLVLAIAAAVGGLDEFAQSFSPARHASLADWTADLTGAGLALLLLLWLRRKRTRSGTSRAPGP